MRIIFLTSFIFTVAMGASQASSMIIVKDSVSKPSTITLKAKAPNLPVYGKSAFKTGSTKTPVVAEALPVLRNAVEDKTASGVQTKLEPTEMPVFESELVESIDYMPIAAPASARPSLSDSSLRLLNKAL